MIVAMDPGTKAVGVALFSDEGELLTAYLVQGLQVVSKVNATGSYVFIEYPRVYPPTVSKGDPNDLIQVALVSGGLAERARGPDTQWVRLVCAPEWTNVPKAIQNARTLKALKPYEVDRIEKRPKSLRHNIIDAIGLGLWGLKTLGIKREDLTWNPAENILVECPSKTFSKSSPKKSGSKRAKSSSKPSR